MDLQFPVTEWAMSKPERIADNGTDPRAAAAVALLRSTRWITISAVVLLSFQLYGNLYEEIVSNVRAIAHPVPGQLVGPLEPGSPLSTSTCRGSRSGWSSSWC